MDYFGPGKAIIEKKRHWYRKSDPLQDRIDEIDSILMVTEPGTAKYTELLEQRKKVEDIRKVKKEIRIMGLTPKEAIKLAMTGLLTGGIYILGYLLDIDSPKALRHADRMRDISDRLSRED